MKRFMKSPVTRTGAYRFLRLTILDSWKYVPISSIREYQQNIIVLEGICQRSKKLCQFVDVYDLTNS